MLEEHNRLVSEARKQVRFAEAYMPPTRSATEEIEELRASYQSMVEENHKRFLWEDGIPFSGVKKNGKKSRTTHCYVCKSNIDNELFMECLGCGWIICSCGACGCGYVTIR